jgi:hypothetical protein
MRALIATSGVEKKLRPVFDALLQTVPDPLANPAIICISLKRKTPRKSCEAFEL